MHVVVREVVGPDGRGRVAGVQVDHQAQLASGHVDEVDLSPRATHVLIDLKVADATATILTNDLTHDYVHENSAYSS